MLYTIENVFIWAATGLLISGSLSYLICKLFLWKDNDDSVSG